MLNTISIVAVVTAVMSLPTCIGHFGSLVCCEAALFLGFLQCRQDYATRYGWIVMGILWVDWQWLGRPLD